MISDHCSDGYACRGDGNLPALHPSRPPLEYGLVLGLSVLFHVMCHMVQAVAALNGRDGMFVDRWKSKAEREKELRARYAAVRQQRIIEVSGSFVGRAANLWLGEKRILNLNAVSLSWGTFESSDDPFACLFTVYLLP
jgi:hypothetical protein